MNARDYLTSTFLKKAEVRASGPQRLRIKDVDQAEGLPGRNGKPAVPELHLVFTDDRRFSLRAQVNLQRMLEWFGENTETWRGKTIEIYFNPDVTNPSGGEPGGLRLRLPEPGPTKALSFRSELEGPATTAVPVPAAPGETALGDEDIPF